MGLWDEFKRSSLAAGSQARSVAGRTLALHYGDWSAEHAAIDTRGAISDRADRATLRITGPDRAAWLHNLTTNEVRELAPGQGRYAFVLDVKGRILLDLNVLVDDDCIWVDLDRRVLETALAHFEKHTIIEDVTVVDQSDAVVHLSAVGPHGVAAARCVLGHGPPGQLALQKCPFERWETLLYCDRFCGVESWEIIAPPEAAVALWKRLSRTGEGTLEPAGWQALDTLRVEAGVPWPVSELNDEVVPAETLLLERAVSFNKGCYLGQEVVERMRAHGSLARKLVGLEFSPGDTVPTPGPLEIDGKTVGTVTSFCHSPQLDRPIALGYIRVVHSAPGTIVVAGRARASVRELPFQGDPRTRGAAPSEEVL